MRLEKGTLRNIMIILLISFIILILYPIIHESAHWTACEIIGSNGDIKIDIFQNPPKYEAKCYDINEKTDFRKFLFWGSPYLVSFIIMVLLFFYLPKYKFYLIGIPLGILLSDFMNVLGFCKWVYETGESGNDLINILIKTDSNYFYILILTISITLIFFILILLSFLNSEYQKKNNSPEKSS